MADAIQDARTAVLAERERILAEIREREARLVEIDAAVASLDRLLEEDGRTGRRAGRPRGGRMGAGNGRRARGIRAATAGAGRSRGGQPSMVALIETYLDAQGRKSAHADDIMKHLESINRQPGGKNPKGTLRTTLGQLEKRGRIRNIGRNRWRFNRRPPAATRRRRTGAAPARAAA